MTVPKPSQRFKPASLAYGIICLLVGLGFLAVAAKAPAAVEQAMNYRQAPVCTSSQPQSGCKFYGMLPITRLAINYSYEGQYDLAVTLPNGTSRTHRIRDTVATTLKGKPAVKAEIWEGEIVALLPEGRRPAYLYDGLRDEAYDLLGLGAGGLIALLLGVLILGFRWSGSDDPKLLYFLAFAGVSFFSITLVVPLIFKSINLAPTTFYWMAPVVLAVFSITAVAAYRANGSTTK